MIRDLGAPAFNSALAYLERIDKLKKTVHEFSINNDFEKTYYSIFELQTEIVPRLRKLKLTKDEDKLSENQKSCERLLLNPSKNKMQELIYKKKLMTWFVNISTLIHAMGLEMPETDKGLGAEDVV